MADGADEAVYNLVDIPIDGGMNEKVHKHRSIQPQVVENRRQWKTGSLGRRWGSRAIAPYNIRRPGSTPPTPELLGAFGDSPLMRVGASQLDVQDTIGGTDWGYIGRIPVNGITTRPIASSYLSLDTPDCATSTDGTYTVVVWSVRDTTQYILARVVHNTTGVTSNVIVASGSVAEVPRVAFIQNTTTVVVGYSNAAHVFTVAFDCTTLSLSSPLTVASTYGDSPFAMCQNTSEAGVVLLIQTGATTLTVARVASANTLTQAVTITPSNNLSLGGLGVATSNGLAWLTWGEFNVNGRCVYAIRSATSLSTVTLAPTEVEFDSRLGSGPSSFVAVADATHAWIVYQAGAATSWTYVDSSGTIGDIQYLNNYAPLTQPWVYSGRAYLVVAQAGTHIGIPANVIDLGDQDASQTNTSFPIGEFAYGQIDGNGYSVSSLPSVLPLSSTVVRTVVPNYIATGAIGGSATLADISYSATRSLAPAGTLVVGSGACPWYFDRQAAFEAGFQCLPLVPSSLTGGSGGSLTPSATYSYILVYEFRDAGGNVHRSQISDTAAITLTSGQSKVTLTLTYCTLTSKDLGTAFGKVELAIYRTLADGATFYRVASVANDRSGTTVTYQDTHSDATISTYPVLYTTGGILEFCAPPSFSHVARALGRIWGVGDDGTVWYSGTLLEGDPPKFNPTFTLAAFDTDRFVAVQQLDNNVILFKQNSIWFTYGDGPDDTGAGSFAQLTRVSSEIGCVDPRGLTVTKDGIWFNSKTGPALLTRSLDVEPLALPVEDTAGITSNPQYSIVAGVSLGSLQETRFAIGGSGDRRAIVFDEHHGSIQQPVWYRYTWPAWSSGEIVGACLYNNLFTWITSDGYVFQDNPGSYLDTFGASNFFFGSDIRLAQFHTSSLQSFLRCWRAGPIYDSFTAADMLLSITVNDDPTTTITQTFKAGVLYSGTNKRILKRLKRQRCHSVELRIRDTTPSDGSSIGTGQGFTISGVCLEYGSYQGAERLAASQRG